MKINIPNIAETNESDVVDFLSNCADINLYTTSQISQFLLETIIYEYTTTFDFLLSSVTNIEWFINASENPLLYRCTQFQFEAGILSILNKFEPPLSIIIDSIVVALKSNNLPLIKTILSNHLYDFQSFNPFLELPIDVPLDVFSFLLLHPAFDPSEDSNSAYFLFNQINRKDLLQMLLLDDRVVNCAFRHGQTICSHARLLEAVKNSPNLFL